MLLPEKFYECLKHDGVVAVATSSEDNKVHIANTWNSYINVTEEGKLLIPAAGSRKTEKNYAANPYAELTLGAREVMGHRTPGAGFLLTGKLEYLTEGELYDMMYEKFPFLSRVLVFIPETCKQTI